MEFNWRGCIVLGISEIVLIAAIFLSAGMLVALYARRKNPVSAYFTHDLCGFLGLAAIYLTTGYTGIAIGINLFTCLVTALLGLPGVVTMSILHFVWAI